MASIAAQAGAQAGFLGFQIKRWRESKNSQGEQYCLADRLAFKDDGWNWVMGRVETAPLACGHLILVPA